MSAAMTTMTATTTTTINSTTMMNTATTTTTTTSNNYCDYDDHYDDEPRPRTKATTMTAVLLYMVATTDIDALEEALRVSANSCTHFRLLPFCS